MTAITQTSAPAPYARFRFTYRFDGADWSFEIPALSLEEAKERVKVLAFARPESETPAMRSRATRPQPWSRRWFRTASGASS